MNNLRSRLAAILILSLTALSLSAELKLPYFFSDGMVLQQQTDAPIWGQASPGATVRVKTSWNKETFAVKADTAGKWLVKVRTPQAGGPYQLTVQEISAGKGNRTTSERLNQIKVLNHVLIGEVWILGGQSNMEIPLKGWRDQPILGSNEEILNSAGRNIHWFKVNRGNSTQPVDTVKPCEWKTAAPDNVADLSATGWFFAKMLSQHLQETSVAPQRKFSTGEANPVPIGLLVCNYGGSSAEAWMSPDALKDFPEVKIPTAIGKVAVPNRTATILYNNMLHPIVGYGIRGVVWYQGETNYPRPKRYEQLFPALVKNWRDLWGQGDFPFYYTQIAPFEYPVLHDTDYVNSAYLRDAQRKVEPLLQNSGMVVLMDGGDSLSIHPANKRLPGERLALMALKRTYGMPGISDASPRYKSLEVKNNEAILTFDEATLGLAAFGQPLAGFEVAGSDRVFHPAQARIQGGKLVVSSAAVSVPEAVRYAFTDYARGCLFGSNGLPVSSFRTDDW